MTDEVPSGATPFTFVHDGIGNAVAQARNAGDALLVRDVKRR